MEPGICTAPDQDDFSFDELNLLFVTPGGYFPGRFNAVDTGGVVSVQGQGNAAAQ